MTNEEQARADCLRAAAVLEERGLCKDRYYSEETNAVCLAGALDCAIGRGSGTKFPVSERYQRAAALVQSELEQRWSWFGGTLSAWNDQPERTQDEVVALLRRAAGES